MNLFHLHFNEWIFFLFFFFLLTNRKTVFSVWKWKVSSTLYSTHNLGHGFNSWSCFGYFLYPIGWRGALMIKHMWHTMNGEALVSCSPSYIFPACFYSQLITYWWFVTALRINQMHFKWSVTQLSPRKSIWKSNDSAHIWSLFNWGRGASGLEFLTRNLLWLDMSAYTMRFISFLILLYDTWCTNWHHKRPMAT